MAASFRPFPAPMTAAAARPAPLFVRPVRKAGALPSYRALIAFLLLLYSNVALWVPGLDVVRPAQVAVVAAALMLAFEGMTGRRRLGLVWPESPLLLGFLLASYLTSFTAMWPRWAIETSFELTKCAVVYFLVALTADSVARIKALLWTLVVGGLFPAFGTLLFYVKGWMEEGRSGWLGIFANSNDVAYSLVILLPIAYALGSLSGWTGRLFVGFTLLAYSAAIYTTFSRGGLLGFFAVLVVIGLRVRSHVMRFAALGLMALAGIAVAYFWQRADGFAALDRDATLNQRVITLKAGMEMFTDHPLLGVGAGCSVVAFAEYAPGGALTHKALIVHNTVVQALAEFGLLGSVPYLLLIVVALFGAHQMARRRTAPGVDPQLPVLMAALEAALVGFVVCGLASGLVLSWFPYILFGLVSAARRLTPSSTGAALPEAA